jgi:hypothetical protein
MQSRGVVDNYYVEETVVLGGADACPKCTRMAEIEYRAGKA